MVQWLSDMNIRAARQGNVMSTKKLIQWVAVKENLNKCQCTPRVYWYSGPRKNEKLGRQRNRVAKVGIKSMRTERIKLAVFAKSALREKPPSSTILGNYSSNFCSDCFAGETDGRTNRYDEPIMHFYLHTRKYQKSTKMSMSRTCLHMPFWRNVLCVFCIYTN